MSKKGKQPFSSDFSILQRRFGSDFFLQSEDPLRFSITIDGVQIIFHFRDKGTGSLPSILVSRTTQAVAAELSSFLQTRISAQAPNISLTMLASNAQEWMDNRREREGFSSIPTPTSRPLCRFYKAGHCKFGGDCINRHPGHQNRLHKGMNQSQEDKEDKEREEREESSDTKSGMRTSTDVIKRLQWDQMADKSKFVVGYEDRFVGIMEKPFSSFCWEDISSLDNYTFAIPRHRIQYFSYRGVIIWDRRIRQDNIFGSTPNSTKLEETLSQIDAKLDSLQAENKDVACENTDDQTEESKNEHKGERQDMVLPREPTLSRISHTDSKVSPIIIPREKTRPNFFICFRVTNDQVRQQVEQVQSGIISREPLFRDAALAPVRLHVTLCTLRLESEQDIQCVRRALYGKKISAALVKYLHPRQAIRFQGTFEFRDRVIHTRPFSSFAQNDAARVIAFAKVLDKEMCATGVNVITSREGFVPHMTILKLNREMCRERPTGVNRGLYADFTSIMFGEQRIEGIFLCSMLAPPGDDGFYETHAHVAMPSPFVIFRQNLFPSATIQIPESCVNRVLGLLWNRIRSSVPPQFQEWAESILKSTANEVRSLTQSGPRATGVAIFEALVSLLEYLTVQEQANEIYASHRHSLCRGDVVILRGLPGSGKSSLATSLPLSTQSASGSVLSRDFLTQLTHGIRKPDSSSDWFICSADNFFLDEQGRYCFNPTLISNAHEACFTQFVQALENRTQRIVVDNTNSQYWEYRRYQALAQALGWRVSILEMQCPSLEVLSLINSRNTHGVSPEISTRMWNRWEIDAESVLVKPYGIPQDVWLNSILQEQQIKFSYIGLFFDAESQAKIAQMFPPIMNPIDNMHVTLAFSPTIDHILEAPIGALCNIRVMGHIANEKAQILVVDFENIHNDGSIISDIPSSLHWPSKPHITISIARGEKPSAGRHLAESAGSVGIKGHEIMLTCFVGITFSFGNNLIHTTTNPIIVNSLVQELNQSSAEKPDHGKARSIPTEQGHGSQKNKIKVLSEPQCSNEPHTLAIFDFDHTLLKTPGPEEGKKLYFEATGQVWPHRGWVSNAESLKSPVQALIRPGPSLPHYHRLSGCSGVHIVVNTGRLENLESEVRDALAAFGVFPAEIYCTPRQSNFVSFACQNKVSVVTNLISKYQRTLRSVLIFDDDLNALREMEQAVTHHRFTCMAIDGAHPCPVEQLFSSIHNTSEKQSESRNSRKQQATNLHSAERKVLGKDTPNDTMSGVVEMLYSFGFCPLSMQNDLLDHAHAALEALSGMWETTIDKNCNEEATRFLRDKEYCNQLVVPYGSFPLGKVDGDIDVCLLSCDPLDPQTALVALASELALRGFPYVYEATDARCPRLVCKFFFNSSPPIELDITVAQIQSSMWPLSPRSQVWGVPDVAWTQDARSKLVQDEASQRAWTGVEKVAHAATVAENSSNLQVLSLAVQAFCLILKRYRLQGPVFALPRTFQWTDLAVKVLSHIPPPRHGWTPEYLLIEMFKECANMSRSRWVTFLGPIVCHEICIENLMRLCRTASELLEDWTLDADPYLEVISSLLSELVFLLHPCFPLVDRTPGMKDSLSSATSPCKASLLAIIQFGISDLTDLTEGQRHKRQKQNYDLQGSDHNKAMLWKLNKLIKSRFPSIIFDLVRSLETLAVDGSPSGIRSNSLCIAIPNNSRSREILESALAPLRVICNQAIVGSFVHVKYCQMNGLSSNIQDIQTEETDQMMSEQITAMKIPTTRELFCIECPQAINQDIWNKLRELMLQVADENHGNWWTLPQILSDLERNAAIELAKNLGLEIRVEKTKSQDKRIEPPVLIRIRSAESLEHT